MADHTTEQAAVMRVSEEAAVLPAGEPDVRVSDSNEEIHEESAQDTEPARLIEHESFDSEPTKESLPKPVLEVAESVKEGVKLSVESALLGPRVVEMSDTETEESPVQVFSADIQKKNETGKKLTEMKAGSEGVEREVGFNEANARKHQESEMEKSIEIENVEVTVSNEEVEEELHDDKHLRMLPGPVERPEETESEFSEEKKHDVGAEDKTEEELDRVQGAEGAVIKFEVGDKKVEAEKDLLGEHEVLPTRKTILVETRQEPEVNMDTNGPIKRQESAIMKSKAMGGTAHEVNDVNEIITSRDLIENRHDKPAMMNTVEELPSTSTLGRGLKDKNKPAEEPEDNTHSKALGQVAWKTGAIAAAFFLILQTVVTIVYILKCRRNPNSVISKKLCARGNGGVEYDATNTDTTIPIDERIAVDDLPEYSQVQQEDVAMTTIPPDCMEKNSSRDPSTSVV
ncbi:uncharacterized protein [Paramisgurnus dabryanus]|uniref:uncharacterized protein n=1 Tax=Paramisgurnus dabryanus TaxID=90735 RepID=UPI003CCF616C